MVENIENLLLFLNNLDYIDAFIYIFIFYFTYIGWNRGALVMIYYIFIIVLSINLSFRYSFDVGVYIGSWLNSDPQTSQLFAGISILIATLTLGSFFQTLIYKENEERDFGSKVLGSISSIFLSNLILGFVFTVLSLITLPRFLDEGVEKSNIISFYLNSEGVSQQLLEVITGSDILKITSRIKELTGSTSISLDENDCLEIPGFTKSKLMSKQNYALELFNLVNIERINQNSDPLEFSQTLSNVATSYAQKMYSQGFWCHKDPYNGFLVYDRLIEAGYPPPRTIGENLAMSSTIYSGHESLMDSESHKDTILDSNFKRIGIGVVSGPNGLIIVQIFS